MSGLRGWSAVAADQRSVLPRLPGIPWWAAAVLAVAVSAIGFALDAGSGNQALGGVFAACYALGCVLAVLAVRQSGIFTAVIQPPLILFVTVPFAYFVFHGSTVTGIKDLLINCGYPLIERFPLMFLTSAAVLVIGLVRWYLGASRRRVVPPEDETLANAPAPEPAETSTPSRRTRRKTAERPRRATAAAAAAASDDVPQAPRRSTRGATPQRPAEAAASAGSRRSRHARPAETEGLDPAPSRPRRRSGPPVDPSAEPRRRPRSGESRDPRERRPLPPLDRRGAYDRPERDRPERYDRPQRRERPETFDRPERSERSERSPRRPRVSSDYEPYEPPPSRPNGSNGTHHPISRVRYRDVEDGESRTEHRTRPRPSRHAAPESWE